jgi:hypothetical protein
MKTEVPLLAPCPFCNRDIPHESKVCPYCGKKFEEISLPEIDTRLNFEPPKMRYKKPKGYSPAEGMSKKQKRLIFYIITITIAVSIIVVALSLIF